MTRSFINTSGSSILLGRELGKGGEGSVFDIPSLPQQVAKIYHRPLDAAKQAKLAFMAMHGNANLLNYASWPQGLLLDAKGKAPVGFLMPKFTGRDPIHMLYSPAHRRQERPKAAWDFLLYSARNIAAAFETLHSHGHVLGDVNQGNVLVGTDSKVVLIDCDSFQIRANGVTHYCEVGVSHFTPPELQGLSSFNGLLRTTNHDNFGLALLIFHLLFGGRHPYSGVPLRKEVGEAMETDIKAFRYAYSRDASSRGTSPPPKPIPISLVPEVVERMFFDAFTEVGAKELRPSANQWVATLDGLLKRLKKCSSTSMHVYPDHLAQCPWCTLEQQGIVYFIDLGSEALSRPSDFILARAWTMIDAVRPPEIIVIPRTSAYLVQPAALPSGVVTEGQRIFYKILIVSIAVGMCLLFPKGIIVWLIGAVIGWLSAGSAGSAERRQEKQRRTKAETDVRAELAALVSRVQVEAGPEGFQNKKQELVKLRDEYQNLAETEKSELVRLHSTAEARQRHQFLDKIFIDVATIPGVGLAKKAALRSFGIETAADVSWNKVNAVKGFGDVLTRAVVDWRKSCERKFTFNPRNAVTDSDRNAVRMKIASRRKTIESTLTAGPADLQKFTRDASAKLSSLNPLLESTVKRYAQAQADLGLIS